MTPTPQQIEAAAEQYAEQQNSAYTNDCAGFIAGAEWALQQSRWIPVEERLPGDAEANPDYPRNSIPFLVIAPTGQNVAVYHYASREWLQKGTSIFIPNVTHWQLLPEAPKQ